MPVSKNRRKDGSKHSGRHYKPLHPQTKNYPPLPVPFVGLLICSLCGKQTESAVDIYSGGWRAVDGAGHRVYTCPTCTPKPEETAFVWEQFYINLGRMLYEMNHCQPMEDFKIWREVEGGPPQAVKPGEDAR